MACYMYVLSSHQLNSHLKIRNFASLHPLCDRAELYVIQMAVDNYHWLVGLCWLTGQKACENKRGVTRS